MVKVKTAYVGMCVDILHVGHINLLEFAGRIAETVVVGLLTDDAMRSYKGEPFMCYEDRCRIVSSLKTVSKVISQNTLDYTNNLLLLKPEAVVHADDWQKGPQVKTREKVLEVLKTWDGMLFEPEYTPGISSTMLKEALKI